MTLTACPSQHLFFFEQNELDGNRPTTNTRTTGPSKPGAPVISDHFVARRRVAIGPHWSALIEKRNSECARGSARQHAAPTDAPRLLNATPQGVSDRALAKASKPRNDMVSADHRPPTSQAWPCCRGPTLVWVSSFLRLRATSATPSTLAA